MGTTWGSNIVRDGLILHLDAANVKSFPGEPTTNLSYNNGQTNSEYLATLQTWVNSGAWTYNGNETDVSKPIIDGFDTSYYRIQSGIVTTAGNIHFGGGNTTISPSTEYTVSIYFRQNRATASQYCPTIRTDITNLWLAELTYNGDNVTSNWPINEWIRISGTATMPTGETGLYITNYIGNAVGDKIWYFGHQVEQKSHVTNLVAGTRGSTVATSGGWKDLSGYNNNPDDISNMTFSTSKMSFNGSSNYINQLTIPDSFWNSGSWTVSVWCKFITVNKGSDNTIFSHGIADADKGLHLVERSSYVYFGFYGNDLAGTITLSGNTWYNIVYTFNYLTKLKQIYVNNVFDNSGGTVGYSGTGQNTRIGMTVYGGGYLYGEIPIINLYNKVLSLSEISQNFTAWRYRFGI